MQTIQPNYLARTFSAGRVRRSLKDLPINQDRQHTQLITITLQAQHDHRALNLCITSFCVEQPHTKQYRVALNLMEIPVFSPSLQDIVDHILTSRCITRMDQRLLLSLTNFSGDEQTLLNEVFDRLRKGLLRVVD